MRGRGPLCEGRGRLSPSRLVKEELRRMRIDSERYTGWTRLGMGRRKRRTAASAAEASRWVPRGGGHASAWRATTTTGDLTTVRPMPPRLRFGPGGFSYATIRQVPGPYRPDGRHGRRIQIKHTKHFHFEC